MNSQVSRMQFLRGDFKGNEIPLRPPWAIDEILFTEICTSCGDCISHCPTHIIKAARGNYPIIDFTQGECLFCEQCTSVCQPQALIKTTHKIPWQIYATVDKNVCIAHQGVECRSCYDPCQSRAITMPLRLGAISFPVIDTDSCNGCGACISTCPTQAISMTNHDE